MPLPHTLGLLAGAIGLIVLFGWLGARPLDINKGPRLIPWRALMVATSAGALVLFVHLLNLIGVRTGG